MKFLRKTIIGVSAIAFTAVTLTATTFAWFEIYSEANVKGLNITANSGLGFMISVDGKNYKNDLTADEIYGAMLVKYSPNKFGFKYDEDTETSTLYLKKANDNYDENHNLIGEPYVFDRPANTTDIGNAMNELQLMPLTSYDGVKIEDLYGIPSKADSGGYIEFDVYFKTTGTRGEYKQATEVVEGTRYYQYTDPYYVNTDKLGITITDTNVSSLYYKYNDTDSSEEYKTGLSQYNPDNNYTYYKQFYNVVDVTERAQNILDTPHSEPIYELSSGYMYEIYLNGESQVSENVYQNGVLIQEATAISPTRFTSRSEDILPISLGADMVTVQQGQIVPLYAPTDAYEGDNITVYGANALRMSITDNQASQNQTGVGTLVYELNDSLYGSKDLGSYATTYSEAYCTEHGKTFDPELSLKYSYANNAMYTYYTNLKQSTALKDMLLDLDAFPTTISDLTSKDANGDYLYNKRITTLSSGEEGKKLTFRIWLEGWDADCFDGIQGRIQSQLSFTSKRIK